MTLRIVAYWDGRMTFEKWWADYLRSGLSDKSPKDICAAAWEAWEAANYAANLRAGDESNEAEKDARRKTALIRLRNLSSPTVQQLDDLLKECQG